MPVMEADKTDPIRAEELKSQANEAFKGKHLYLLGVSGHWFSKMNIKTEKWKQLYLNDFLVFFLVNTSRYLQQEFTNMLQA